MDGVDGEYYLRRYGEDGLAARYSSDDLRHRARALAAVDILSPVAAAAILADYDRARSLRGLVDDRGHFEHELAEGWTPPTIRSCGRSVQTDWGLITLHYLTIGPSESTIAVTMTKSPAGAATGRNRPTPRRRHAEPPDLDLVDDQGTALSGHFGGSGNNGVMVGQYSVHPSLDPACAFIVVAGERVELDPVTEDVLVRVEGADPGRPAAEHAARYLRRCLAAPSHHYEQESIVSVTVDTFLECGILPADADVLVEAAEARKRADQAVPGIAPRPVRAGGLRPAARAQAVLRDRVIGVSESLPGGIHVAITDLRATSEGVTVGFQAAVTSAESMVRSVTECFAMTATDAAGNQCPGALDGWGSGGGTFHGRMIFREPLTPATTVLQLRVLTDRADVVLDIPVTWDGAS